MGIRITGINVPFGGISWEYTETEKQEIQKLVTSAKFELSVNYGS